MNDLISRAALLERFAEMQKNDPEKDGRGFACHFLNDAREPSTEWYCVEDAVESIPTVDAVPVVHAYWIDCSDGNDGTVCRKCSACKDMQLHYSTYYPNFCPDCGAKMDGKRGDEE